MKTIFVVAEHPDDKVLGCGGTLLKHVYNEIEFISYLFLITILILYILKANRFFHILQNH
jgi:hypothetical protein